MANKPKFLKNILTTASALAVIASASNAMGASRQILANPANHTGVGVDHGLAGAIVAGNALNVVAVAPNSTLQWITAGATYTHNASNLSAIDMKGVNGTFVTGGNATLGPIVNSTGAGKLALTINGAHNITLSGVQAAALADRNGGVVGQFTAAANDYNGLGDISLANAVAKLIIDSSTTLTGSINANAGGNGLVEVTTGKTVVFAGSLGGTTAIKSLSIADNANATLAVTSKFTNAGAESIKIGNGSTLSINNGVSVVGTNSTEQINGSLADKGTLKFLGASVVSQEIGSKAKLNKVEFAGAGEVELKTNVAKATSFEFSNQNAVFKSSGNAGAVAIEGNFIATQDGFGKIIIKGQDHTLNGSVGVPDKKLGEINFASDNELSFAGADNLALNAKVVTTAVNNTGTLDFTSGNFAINSVIGTDLLKLKLVTFDSNNAGAAATFKLNAGSKINATDINIALSNVNNIVELYEGSEINGNIITNNNGKGVLLVKGNSTTGKIGALATRIDQIKFDTAGKTLTVKDHTGLGLTNGVNFAEDATLDFTGAGNLALDKTIAVKQDANGSGTIKANAINGSTITISEAIGDVTVADKALKLLEAKGGATSITLAKSAAIKKIDIGTQNTKLILNVAGGSFKISEFAHSNNNGIVEISEDATLKTGTVLSTANSNLKGLTFTADKTLTIEDDVNIYTGDEGIRNTGVGSGDLVFSGKSIVGAVVGQNNKFGDITINGIDKSVSFLKKVSAEDILVANGSSIVFADEVVADSIESGAAGTGTVKFANAKALTINTQIGNAAKFKTIEINGADLTTKHVDFKANNISFTSAGNATLTLEAAAANDLQNVTITTNSTSRGHNIATKESHQLDKSVGSATNKFGNIILQADKIVKINSDFHGGVVTATNQTGKVEFLKSGSLAYNLGESGKELLETKFSETASVAGPIYSKDIIVAANKAATFKGVTSSSNGITLGAASSAIFDGDIDLDSVIKTAAPSQGIVSFNGNNKITKVMGDATNVLNKIAFTGAGKVHQVGADFNATNISVTGTELRAINNITSGGAATISDAKLDLADKMVTFKTANSTITNSTVGFTLNSDGATAGKIVADGITLTTSGAISVSITDNSLLPKTDRSFTLLGTANGGAIAGNAAVTVVKASANRFVDWSYANNVLTQKNNAVSALKSIVGTGNALLAEDAAKLGNPSNTADALAYVTDLSQMKDAEIKESVERLTNTGAVHHGSALRDVTTAASQVTLNRIGALSTHPTAGIQTADASSGVNAGDNDSQMYGAWFSPFYAQNEQKAKNNVSGYQSKSFGATLGFDTMANADMTIGIAGTYAKTDIKHKNVKSGDKTKADTYMFTIYGIQQLTNEWFLQGMATFSSSKVKNTEKRGASTGAQYAKGSFDTTTYGGELMAGYNHIMGEATITPLGGLRFTRINDGGYKETGTTNQNLSVTKDAANKVEAIFGARAQMNTSYAEGIQLTPEVHGFVRHDFVGKSAKASIKLDGLVNQLAPKGAATQKTFFDLGFGVNAKSGMYEYGAGYDATIANKYVGHQGTIKVRVNF